MMPYSSIFGLAANAFIATSIVVGLAPIGRLSFRQRVFIALLVLAAMFAPIDGLVIAGYVRGLIGDPSMTTLVLVACILVRKVTGRELFARSDLGATMLLTFALGIFLFPMAMGLGPYDPYRLGFGSWPLTIALLLLTLAAASRGFVSPVLCMVLGMGMYAAGIGESTNLWNYIIDPIAFIFATSWLLGCATGSLRRSASARKVVSA